ncbi:MAG: regulatory protein, TetR [Burkholderiaceae bacterium]|jgi:AcrR family transcriptional regulator|nr:MAG: regulatory protein, TetR [Burkholderiaceae bacterium]
MPPAPPELLPKPPRHLVRAPRQQRGRDRQDALIRAGLHLTETRNWDEVKVEDIAAEIGCSTGTFYTRFRNKAAYFDVLVDLVTQVMQTRSNAFFDAPERGLETPQEFIERWIALALHSFATHRGLYATAVIELRRHPPQVVAASPLLRFRDRSREQFMQAMARWPRWRSAAARRPLLFAHQLVQGVLINAVLTNPGPLQLQDPEFHAQLAAALSAYLGLREASTENPPAPRRTR